MELSEFTELTVTLFPNCAQIRELICLRSAVFRVVGFLTFRFFLLSGLVWWFARPVDLKTDDKGDSKTYILDHFLLAPTLNEVKLVLRRIGFKLRNN